MGPVAGHDDTAPGATLPTPARGREDQLTSRTSADGGDETPTIEVRVWRHGDLVHTELCESDEEAALVVEQWEEVDGVRCEVDDLSVRHLPGDILEPEPPEPPSEDYPEQAEADQGAVPRFVD